MGLKCQKVGRVLSFSSLRCSQFSHFFFFICFICFSFSYLIQIMACVDHFILQSAEEFDRLLNVLNSGSTSDDNHKHTDMNYTDQDRYISTSVIYHWC